MGVLILCFAVDLVSGGQPRFRVETDGSGPAKAAAALIRQHVVLRAGVALPEGGSLPALRIERTNQAGYHVRIEGGGVWIVGADPVRAAYDLIAAWGASKTLPLEARRWRPVRTLWMEGAALDASAPSAGLSIAGLREFAAAEAHVRRLGYELRVASLSFDDFLPPSLFNAHPEWFALRDGKREARGNFALTNADARAAYLDALATWLDAHPSVDVVGLWPEVTTVWCEQSTALGAPEAYALLWREAAARFPKRRLEILATGLTLRPPRGDVPANIDVRFRPGRDASGLQGLAGQPIETIARAWEVRGARLILELDAAPESWCGMPWPCHDAIRANARRFEFAVLRHGGAEHARLWRDPADKGGDPVLLKRAQRVSSWGDPKDAADLFFATTQGMAFKIGATERLLRLAWKDREAHTANDVYAGYQSILSELSAEHARAYRRYRSREIGRLLRELLPEGATRQVGPAKVRETLEIVHVETDLLRLVIDRDRATVTSIQRFRRGAWSTSLCDAAFEVVALAVRSARTGGAVQLSSPGPGKLRIDLRGRLRPDGDRWRSRLDLASGSGIVRQTADVAVDGGVATGCSFPEGRFDRWVCPPHAREGSLDKASPTLPLPAGTLVYCRNGEQGLGLALRPVHGGTAIVDGGLVATRRGRSIMIDWIVFAHTGELGK